MENDILKTLIKKGVKIYTPESVYISNDVNPDRISGENVIIYGGCRITGEKTLIMKNACIGSEAPVTLENTLVGKNTNLKGGFFKEAVFAGNNSFGSGAHVREGTILEEEANAAHTVGLKQTILFPFVTLGSLINFCDCFMAGGTSRKDHSEVGSSFIHFNYTPNQDKATASMLGDVHHGVMLNSRPVFLGGQGGLVGPVRIAYGCMTAAGSIIRKNELRKDRIILGGGLKQISIPRQYSVYKNIAHIFNNNIYYLAGLISLKSWYRYIRPLFANDDLSKELVFGMQDNLDKNIGERIFRLKIFCEKLKLSKKIVLEKVKDEKDSNIVTHEKAIQQFKRLENFFEIKSENFISNLKDEDFILKIKNQIDKTGDPYIKLIQSLDTKAKKNATQWLCQIENKFVKKLLI